MIQDGRTVPDFIIGGAPRSGTTYLCHALVRRPEIFIPQPFIPEPKVFNGHPEGTDFLALYDQITGPARPEQIIIEKSSGCLENQVAGERIKRWLPRIKLVFILREPAARAYSNYLWSVKNGLETLPFDRALEMEGRRPNPLGPEPERTPPFDYYRRSDYAAQARPYLEAFGRDRILFVLFEWIRQNPEKLFGELQSFLGLEPWPADRLVVPRPDYNITSGPALDPALEAALRRRLTPSVRELADLTGLDLSPWGYEL